MERKKPSNGWSNPAIIISLLTLGLSVVTNIYQYFHAKNQIEISQQKAYAEIKNLESQIKDREVQLNLFINEATRLDSTRKEVTSKIEKIDKEIEIWNDALNRRNLDLSEAEIDLQKAINSGDTAQIEREKKFLETIKMFREYTQSKLEQCKSRREDLLQNLPK